MTARRICIGQLAGAHGVKGQVKIRSFCANASDIATYGTLTSADGMWLYDVELQREAKPGIFVGICKQITDREEAEALKGTRLYVDRDKLPDTTDDEFYIEDLIGLEVRSIDQVVVGKVKSVQNFGAGDILDIEGVGDTAHASGMFAFTKAIVPVVDIAHGFIVLDPPKEVIADQSEE